MLGVQARFHTQLPRLHVKPCLQVQGCAGLGQACSRGPRVKLSTTRGPRAQLGAHGAAQPVAFRPGVQCMPSCCHRPSMLLPCHPAVSSACRWWRLDCMHGNDCHLGQPLQQHAQQLGGCSIRSTSTTAAARCIEQADPTWTPDSRNSRSSSVSSSLVNSWPSCCTLWSRLRVAANAVGSALARGPACSSPNSRLRFEQCSTSVLHVQNCAWHAHDGHLSFHLMSSLTRGPVCSSPNSRLHIDVSRQVCGFRRLCYVRLACCPTSSSQTAACTALGPASQHNE